MDHTVDQIEADIDQAAAGLGSHLRELEDQFEVAIDSIDWREHFQARPWLILGAAGVVGFVLGAALRPWEEDGERMRHPSSVAAVGQLSPLLDDIAEALIAVATSSVKGAIAGMVPGFKEHLARIEERVGSR